MCFSESRPPVWSALTCQRLAAKPLSGMECADLSALCRFAHIYEQRTTKRRQVAALQRLAARTRSPVVRSRRVYGHGRNVSQRALLLATASGCVHYHPAPTDTTNVSHDNLHRLVGQTITLRGNFSLRGKFGPYILVNSGPVYLQPTGSFTWGRSWADMEGRMVKVTGVLHFSPLDAQRAEDTVARAPIADYFYFEAETTTVQPVSP